MAAQLAQSMQENLTNSVYSTSTPSFNGLNFDAETIKTACNDCYTDHLAGNKAITNDCFICAEFTPKIETNEIPFIDFLGIVIIFAMAFYVFKLLFIDIWRN